jgi:serine/threonine protein kinase/tetratricopeptide (TPR) repeat protein
MTEQRLSERSIFEAAIERSSAVERAAYLDQTCGSDAGLRQEIEALLAVHDRLGHVTAPGHTDGLGVTIDDPVRERPGMVIGLYKLMEPIGEGGMGLVFVAEQQQPVRRKVALKVIKPGMDTRQVVARFEAERQALALMDHPNIAKVLDGGTTDSRRPYFVMELVKGVPITEYCDQNQVSIRQRLALFVSVCQAVQHAHQKGIIHRDIKPSNVLVVSHDGMPVVKVIDFGVAKAIGHQLTDKTIYTQFSQMVGTPLYMSPEQAGQSGIDVDTRSDIYALGVLLYELLTGTTPFDKERLHELGYDEMRRIIREEEPPKPSTRISTLGQAAATVSMQRQSDPKQLSQLIRGELDWIVIKALEKDRNRRYETASAFTADVQRYLADEPVQACPPSAWYRFRKFTRRHRMGLGLAACVLALAFGLTGSAVWTAQQRARRLAETERTVTAALAQAEVLLEEGDKQTENPERWLATVRLAQTALANAEKLLATTTPTQELAEYLQQVRAAVDAALTDSQLVIELERIRMATALLNYQSEKSNEVWLGELYEKALAGYGIDLAAPEAAAARVRGSRIRNVLVAALEDWRDKITELENKRWNSGVRTAVGQASEAIRRRCGPAWKQKDVAALLRISNEPDLRDSALRKALEEWQQRPERLKQDQLDQILPAAEPDPVAFRVRWRVALRRDQAALLRLADEPEAKIQAAADMVRMAYNLFYLHTEEGRAAGRRLLLAAQERYPSDYWVNHSLGLSFSPKPEEGVGYLRAALALRSDSPQAHIYLAERLTDMGDLDGAIRHCQTAVRLDPNYIWAHQRLSDLLFSNGRFDEAIEECRACRRIRGKDDAQDLNLIGAALHRKGLLDEAIAEFRKAIQFDLTKDDPDLHWNLGIVLIDKGQLDEAIAENRQAIQIAKSGLVPEEKNAAPYHDQIGCILYRKRQLDEAIAEFREAIRLDKDYARAHYSIAYPLRDKGLVDEAVAECREAIRLDPYHASAHNNLAWLLATCPDLQLRNYLQAVESAKKAVQLAPKVRAYRNTLGVALCRIGAWKESIAALAKSMQLSKGGDSFDWFFLAMAYQQLGEKEEARQWYGRAVQWMDKNQPKNEELRRFRREAVELLGVNKKSD